jgi:hypothetical protein
MKGALFLLAFWMTTLGLLAWGWVLNLMDLVGTEVFTQGQFVVRVVGIFIPIVGTYMGFFG